MQTQMSCDYYIKRLDLLLFTQSLFTLLSPCMHKQAGFLLTSVPDRQLCRTIANSLCYSPMLFLLLYE